MLDPRDTVRPVLNRNLPLLYPPRFDKTHGPETNRTGIDPGPTPPVPQLFWPARSRPGLEPDKLGEARVDALGAEPEKGAERGEGDEGACVE